MKSSTVRRSALSKESMDIIENLANDTTENNYKYTYNNEYSAPSEYYRETIEAPGNNKSKEIDLLWQTFKSAQFNTKSPTMHWLGGFILGIISTLVAVSFLGMFSANTDNESLQNKFPLFNRGVQEQKVDENIEEASELVKEQNIPTDEVETPVVKEEKISKNKKTSKIKEEKINQENTEINTPVETTKYIIKDGDTVEAIIKRNYGAYTPERAEAIMKANNLKDLDHISIDQELLLPIEK